MILIATAIYSCKQSNKSTPKISTTEISDTIINTANKKGFDSKHIYTTYKYVDVNGNNVIIKNGLPRGGLKYTDKKGNHYNYVIFWTQIINETDAPFELKIDIPSNSYKVPSLPGKSYKVLIPNDTMTLEKLPLYLYGLKNLELYLNNNIDKPSSLERIIQPKESNGFYTIILCLTEGAHGTMRTEFTLREQDLFYRIKIDGSKSNCKSSDMEIRCGSINIKNLTLLK